MIIVTVEAELTELTIIFVLIWKNDIYLILSSFCWVAWLASEVPIRIITILMMDNAQFDYIIDYWLVHWLDLVGGAQHNS